MVAADAWSAMTEIASRISVGRVAAIIALAAAVVLAHWLGAILAMGLFGVASRRAADPVIPQGWGPILLAFLAMAAYSRERRLAFIYAMIAVSTQLALTAGLWLAVSDGRIYLVPAILQVLSVVAIVGSAWVIAALRTIAGRAGQLFATSGAVAVCGVVSISNNAGPLEFALWMSAALSAALLGSISLRRDSPKALSRPE
jgi:hypothetical protein